MSYDPAYWRAWVARNPGRHRRNKRARYLRTRERAIGNLGGVCTRCGAEEGLEIDHIDGDGAQEKHVHGGTAHARFRAARGDTKGLQLLCHSCHVDKTNETRSRNSNGETR